MGQYLGKTIVVAGTLFAMCFISPSLSTVHQPEIALGGARPAVAAAPPAPDDEAPDGQHQRVTIHRTPLGPELRQGDGRAPVLPDGSLDQPLLDTTMVEGQGVRSVSSGTRITSPNRRWLPPSAFFLPLQTPVAASADKVTWLFVPPPPTSLMRVDPGERWIAAPAIGLRERVVPSPLVRVGSGWQWEVPWWEVGHAERTGEFGEPGNVVLFGHVSTINAGRVFRDLHRLKLGDWVYLTDGQRYYTYVVTQVWETVPEDVSVVQPTSEPTVTMITCSGLWVPWQNDFEKRLVVRGKLVTVEDRAS